MDNRGKSRANTCEARSRKEKRILEKKEAHVSLEKARTQGES